MCKSPAEPEVVVAGILGLSEMHFMATRWLRLVVLFIVLYCRLVVLFFVLSVTYFILFSLFKYISWNGRLFQ